MHGRNGVQMLPHVKLAKSAHVLSNSTSSSIDMQRISLFVWLIKDVCKVQKVQPFVFWHVWEERILVMQTLPKVLLTLLPLPEDLTWH